jgi:excinuclease ABC subunit C
LARLNHLIQEPIIFILIGMDTRLALLPTSSGVYLFKDQANNVIYIGKATSLRTRVRSYFKPNTRDWKIDILRSEIADISTIVTKNETEASLLEAQLIKEHQPKFNILLKDGQPFVYLLFTESDKPEVPPKLEIVRNKQEKGTYFGPFLHKTDARRVYAYLLKTFRLKWCNKKIPGGCLDYHLELCPGVCTRRFDNKEYQFRINLAKDALQGNHKEFLRSLKDRIGLYNKNLEFEKSRNLQDYIENFESIFATLRTHYSEKKYAHEAFIATAPVPYKPAEKPGLAQQLQELLQLPKPVVTIDCFDISHFQSNAIVGSCIRFTHGKPEKDKFRKFKVRTLTEQNDYAALQEIVRRRYRHQDYPDLIVIDGGKGQLSAITDIITDVPCVSLAKREETLFGVQFPQGYKLDIKTDIGALFIALRDYAHHFAITYHRTLRSKERKNEHRKTYQRSTRASQS